MSRGAWFGPGDREAVEDFWSVYDRHYDEIQAETLRMATNDPQFGPIVRAMSDEQREQQNAESRALLRRAMDGEWEAYEANLATTGKLYAGMGIDFERWYDLIGAYQAMLVPRLVEAYGKEPPRLSAALLASQRFIDRALAGIGKAYLDERQRKITESEERYRTLVESSRDKVWSSDARGEKGREWLDGSHPEDRPAMEAAWKAGFAGATRVVTIGRLWDAGTERYRHSVISATPIANPEGAPTEFVCAITDVDEGKRSEEALRRAEDEKRRIQDASRLKSEFLANMSHELRTPLNSIIGFAQLLHDGEVDPTSPEHREYLGDILQSGRHLLQLINDVLDLAKVEAGKMEFRPGRLDLAKAVQQAIGLLRGQAHQKRIEVTAEIPEALDDLFLDSARLQQVLFNFLSNALKFTPEGGKVKVRAVPERADTFRLEVTDTGVGIAPDDLQRLFREFEQLDRSTGKHHGGTGLGLALTKRLVEAQGGSVGVSSVLGEGSTFHALLPRRTSAVPLPEPQRFTGAKAGAPSVLVVEDDAEDQAMLIRILSGAGYAVETVATAAQAVSRCREKHFDAVTLDLVLPDSSGLDVLRGIRQSGFNRETPVIVVSVAAAQHSMTAFPVSSVLPKPVDGPAVLAALQEAGLSADVRGVVVVVDDDGASLRLMDATLQSLGYDAQCHDDPRKALAAVRERVPLAMVVDLMMPEMSGFELIHQMREVPRLRSVPILVWTAKDLSHEELRGLHESVQRVLQKSGAAGRTLLDELRQVLPEVPAE